jgi:hypothetical protein
VITIDGEQVYSAPVGGEQDHRVNADDITRTRPVIDGRMSARVFVTAGPHEVGFTWVDQPGQSRPCGSRRVGTARKCTSWAAGRSSAR